MRHFSSLPSCSPSHKPAADNSADGALTLAGALGDEVAYRDYRDRYRAMATSLGFEGHMKWAEAMP